MTVLLLPSLHIITPCLKCSAAGEAQPPKVDAVQLEEEALARIQAAVAERYAAAVAGPEVCGHS